MKTEDLIAALAVDTRPGLGVAGRLMRALPAALAIAITSFLTFWGVRPDIMAAVSSAAVVKPLLPLALAALAGALALALSRPEARAGGHATYLGVLGVAVLAAYAAVAATAGGAGLVQAVAIPSLVTCLASIPILAMPLLGAALWALSAGASRRPALSGAVGGLAAGGIAATVYSFYCDQDAALFFLPAYAGAILLVAAIGMLVGSRTLAW